MKNVFKRIIVFALVIVSVLSFSGCIKGKSAYELAVANGFSGTEQEWLASLKGVKGQDGADNDITIEDLYEAARNDGFEGSMSDFIKEYLNANAQIPDEKNAVNKAVFSVCDVIANFQTKDSIKWGMTVPGKTVTSAGAGVVYSLDKESGDAYVITNHHVVYNSESSNSDCISDEIKLYFYGSDVYNYFNGTDIDYGVPATYVGGSMTYDIAVLRVDGSEILKNSDVCAVTINESDRTVIGSKAIAIGNPEGNGIAVSSGIVSVDSELIGMTAVDGTSNIYYRCIRVDCAINAGNSGGGLFDDCGRLIGIVNAKVVSEDVDNIGYAIPVSLVTKVADNIIRNSDRGGKGVYTARLGITITTASVKSIYDSDTKTAKIIEEVTIDEASGSAASVYLQKGDVIVSISKNDEAAKTVERRYDVTDFMLTPSVGDTVHITVKRNVSGETKTLTYDFALTEDFFVSVK